MTNAIIIVIAVVLLGIGWAFSAVENQDFKDEVRARDKARMDSFNDVYEEIHVQRARLYSLEQKYEDIYKRVGELEQKYEDIYKRVGELEKEMKERKNDGR